MASVKSILRRRPWLLFAVVAAVAGVAIFYLGRGLSFHFDEWDFITGRRGVTAETLFSGHNGHLSVLPVAYYKLMLQVVGLDHYWLYRLVLIALHIGVGALLFVALRRRAGDAGALLGVTLVLFLGSAWENLVWAFQVGFVGSVFAGLAAVVALDRRTRRGNITATLALVAALGCSSLGVPFVLLAAVDLTMRRQWRRLLGVVGPPVALYGLWYLRWGGSDVTINNLDAAPRFVFDMAASAMAGAAGLAGSTAGATLVVLGALALVVVLARRQAGPRLVALLLALLAMWGLTALARAQYGEPDAPRYIYPSVVLLLLVVAELLPDGWRLPRRARPVAAVVVLLAVCGNLATLSIGARGLRDIADVVRPELAALEIARDLAPADYRPDVDRAPQIFAGKYFGAIDAFGSPAPDERRLREATETQREAADRVLRELEAPVLRQVSPATSGRRDCVEVPVGGMVPVPASGIVISGLGQDTVDLGTRRYASVAGETPVARIGRRAVLVTFPRDRGSAPWMVQLTGKRPARVCR